MERKSLADLVASLTGGKLRYALAELAALPRAAVVVEDRYSQVFKLDRVRPALVADGLAELQIRWPNVPIVFCETRQLAEEWTYRFLAAAHAWAETETRRHRPRSARPGDADAATELDQAPDAPAPSTAEVRAWARATGLPVPDRGKLRPEINQAWQRRPPAMIAISVRTLLSGYYSASLGVTPPWAAGLLDPGRRRGRRAHRLGCASHTPRESLPILDAVLDRSMHLAKGETVDPDMAAARLKQRSPCLLVGQLATPDQASQSAGGLEQNPMRVPCAPPPPPVSRS